MRITVKSHLRSSQKRKDGKYAVYASCTMGGSRIELSTGIFFDPDNWDPDGQIMRGRTEKVPIFEGDIHALLFFQLIFIQILYEALLLPYKITLPGESKD